MGARLIPAATEAEWLAARRRGVTASEIAVVMGLSPYSSPFALYHVKRGDLAPQGDSMAMALGRHLEQFVAEAFTERRPEFYRDGSGREPYAHPDRPWQMATPDRLLYDMEPDEHDGTGWGRDPLAVLECKTDNSHDGWGEDGSDEIPVHYRCQVLWQMDVLGVDAGYLACLFLHSRQLRVYELAMDAAARQDLSIMRAEAVGFLNRIEHNDPPDVDWRPASTDALKKLHPLVKDEDAVVPAGMARAYAAACRSLRMADRRKKYQENRIRDRIGAARRAVLKDGTPVATRSVYDVRENVRKAGTTDRLIPAKPPAKKETP